jgi:hypothetical protein
MCLRTSTWTLGLVLLWAGAVSVTVGEAQDKPPPSTARKTKTKKAQPKRKPGPKFRASVVHGIIVKLTKQPMDDSTLLTLQRSKNSLAKFRVTARTQVEQVGEDSRRTTRLANKHRGRKAVVYTDARNPNLATRVEILLPDPPTGPTRASEKQPSVPSSLIRGSVDELNRDAGKDRIRKDKGPRAGGKKGGAGKGSTKGGSKKGGAGKGHAKKGRARKGDEKRSETHKVKPRRHSPPPQARPKTRPTAVHGVIMSLKKNASAGAILRLQRSKNSVAEFRITRRTQIEQVQDGRRRPAQVAAAHRGQKVIVHADARNPGVAARVEILLPRSTTSSEPVLKKTAAP